MTINKTTNRLPWIDALRFMAAFLVLLCHSRNDFFVKYDQLDGNEQGIAAFVFYTITRLGPEAVWMFFIISGFLVGGIGLERIQRGTFRLKDYAVNRTVRIALPLIGAIVFYGIVTLFTDAEWNLGACYRQSAESAMRVLRAACESVLESQLRGVVLYRTLCGGTCFLAA